MTMSLVVLLPLILLGIVGTLCFVGCGFHTHGLEVPFHSYTNITLGNMLCIGYWPLKEKLDTDAAVDLVSASNGKYKDMTTAPELYPWPAYTVQNGMGPDVLSAVGAGTIMTGQLTILSGDTDLPIGTGDTVPPGCMVVDGGFVEVPWNDKFIPKQSFTVEAWVRPDWSVNDPKANRFVVDSRDINPGTGFALFAQADPDQPGVYNWAGIMGNGDAGIKGFTIVVADAVVLRSGEPPADPVYLAMTFDATNQTLTLFVNGGNDGVGVNVPGVLYMPNTTQPLWIGAGAPFVAERPQPAQPPDVPASPLFPFVGAIQDVAIWSDALTPDTIQTRSRNGTGTT